VDSVHHKNLWDFFRGTGQRNWTFLSCQSSDHCNITSRFRGRGQMRSGVLWMVRESQFSPLGCSPLMHDIALLARKSTSLAQLFHMYCTMQLAAASVCAQHALGSGVPRCSMHGCAHTVHAHICARHEHTTHA